MKGIGKAVGLGFKGFRFWRKHEIGKRILGTRQTGQQELTSELIALQVRGEGGMLLKGKLTFAGLAATALGMALNWIGLGDCTPDMIAQYGPEACQQASAVALSLVDRALAFGGLALATYGRIRAARRERALEAT